MYYSYLLVLVGDFHILSANDIYALHSVALISGVATYRQLEASKFTRNGVVCIANLLTEIMSPKVIDEERLVKDGVCVRFV